MFFSTLTASLIQTCSKEVPTRSEFQRRAKLITCSKAGTTNYIVHLRGVVKNLNSHKVASSYCHWTCVPCQLALIDFDKLHFGWLILKMIYHRRWRTHSRFFLCSSRAGSEKKFVFMHLLFC